MRYVFAFLAATLLSWGYVELSRNEFAYYLGMKTGPVGLLVIALIFFICLSFAYFGKPEQHTLTVSPDIKQRVNERFGGRVFIMSSDDYKIHWNKEYRKWLDDEDWDRWEKILKRYPKHPVTQNEALKNEEKFWSGWARAYSEIDQTGNACLWSHASIRDSYEFNERWILRSYYAATGKIIDPYVKETTRLFVQKAKADAFVQWIDTTSPAAQAAAQKNRNDKERLEREIEHCNARGKKDHFDRWGDWFVSHVDAAFVRLTKQDQQPPANSHGEGGFATSHDINNLKNKSLHQPSAQTQRFDD